MILNMWIVIIFQSEVFLKLVLCYSRILNFIIHFSFHFVQQIKYAFNKIATFNAQTLLEYIDHYLKKLKWLMSRISVKDNDEWTNYV